MAGQLMRRAKQVFAGAIELPADERGQFLDRACGDDAALRARVEGLLSAHVEAGDFLAEPTIAHQPPVDRLAMAARDPDASNALVVTAPLERPSERPGMQIGRYKLLQEIGEGGFGVVYMAEQTEPVRRRVALKIIKEGMDTRQIIARFEAERQALAMMDHPNIAKVFDAGATATGRPYFVMELVRGVPITEFCDAQQLTTRERVTLFQSVCYAVQHAHHKGVIHRDIKPTNVLVTLHDDQPVPKVIDFGIAKATDQRLTERTVFTEFRQFIGTPQYMSPEQAQMSGLDVDTRSDVYSLGVLLYELLTGTTPFEAERLRIAGYAEMQRIICEEEPPRPSTRFSTLGDARAQVAQRRRADAPALSRQLRGDLDWIVMRALEKTRTRRYPTAWALAEDIGRCLRNEPVSAGPPGIAYRFRKFTRRYRGLIALTSAVALSLVAGSALAVYGMVQAKRSAARTEQEAAKVGALNDFLTGMLLEADPAVGGGPQMTVRALLDKAAEEVDSGALADQPLIEADARTTIGRTYKSLGDLQPAGEQLARALSIRTQHLGEQHLDVAETLNALGSLARERGDAEAALRAFRDAVAILREHPDAKPKLGDALNNLALLFEKQGRYEQAEKAYEEVLAIDRALYADDDPHVATTLNNLALLVRAKGDEKRAAELFAQALDVLKRAHGENHIHVAAVLESIGAIEMAGGDYDAAEEKYRKALQIRRQVIGDENLYVAHSLNGLGLLLHNKGQDQEAERLLRDALAMQEKLSGADHPRVAGVLNNLGLVLAARGELERAERCYRRALDIRMQRLGAEHAYTLNCMNNLAGLLRRRDKAEEAAELASKAVEIADRHLPDGHWYIASFRGEWGACLMALGRFEQAERELLASRDGLAEHFGPDHARVRRTIERLIELYEITGRPEKAALLRAGGQSRR